MGQDTASIDTGTASMTVLLSTLLYPAGIALVAVVLAWFTAWALRPGDRRHGVLLLALLLIPLLPAYLAYTGLSLARAPGTFLGDLINASPIWINVNAGRVLAMIGLVLWCWPLGTLILLSPVRAVPQEQLDQLALLAPTRISREVQCLRMLSGPIVAAMSIVMLLMLGSAVPLHLANIKTLSIELWAQLALLPGHPRSWLNAWPLILLAIIGAWLMTRVIARWQPADSPALTTPARTQLIVPWLLWIAAVIVPLVFLAINIKQTRFLGEFWAQNGSITLRSVLVAIAAGTMALFVTLASFLACDRPQTRGLARVALAISLMGLLLPGVLVGSAIATGWSSLNQTVVPVIIAHVARSGAIAVAAGFWLSRGETSPLRDARLLAASSLRTWWSLAARPQLATLLGIAAATAALSLHEIEATIQVQPPGYRSLAQVMLDHLHMNSVHELAAAGVQVVGLGVIVALLASLGLRGRANR